MVYQKLLSARAAMPPSKKATTQLIGKLRAEAMIRQHYACIYCCHPIDEWSATADHRIPKSMGGQTTPENIDAACRPCNSLKSDRTPDDFMELITKPLPNAGKKIRAAHLRWRTWWAIRTSHAP